MKVYASKFIPMDPAHSVLIQRELSLQSSLKSHFIQGIENDFFITKEECKTEHSDLVINSELAEENLE